MGRAAVRDETLARLRSALDELSQGRPIDGVLRKHKIAVFPQSTTEDEVPRLERENTRLKRLLADMALLVEDLRGQASPRS